MIARRLTALCCAVALALTAAAVGRPGAAAEPTQRVIVRYSDWVPDALQRPVLASAGVDSDDIVRELPEIGAAVVEVTAGQRGTLSGSMFVEDAVIDRPVRLQATPDDPYVPITPALGDIKAADAWDIFPGAGGFPQAAPFDGAVVAVVDSGIDPDHDEFQPFADKVPVCTHYDPNPLYDPVNCYNGASDTLGHGTHIAGVVAAIADNAVGTAGVAAASPIHVYKACQQTSCHTADIAAGIIDATNDGADVINLSLGGDTPEPVWKDAVRYARERDVIVLAAAGNDGTTSYLYPASFPGVVSVGSTNSGTTVPAGFSRRNNEVDVAAPGTSIWAPAASEANAGVENGYKRLSGTSQSTAYASGVAALARSANPGWSAGRTVGALTGAASDIADPGRDDRTGHGLIDAAATAGYTPTADGDLDDDGIADLADAEPYDPTIWPVGEVTLNAAVGTGRVQLLRFELGDVTLVELIVARGNGHTLFAKVNSRIGSGLHAVTIKGSGFVLGPTGFGSAYPDVTVSAPSNGPATVRVATNSTTIVDGTLAAGTATVETP